MQQRQLGYLWPVSQLSISAAGLASIWGETSEEEGIATLHEALDAGINHIDVAPSYGRGRAEQLLGKAMTDGWPKQVRLTTKVRIGSMPAKEVLPRLRQSLKRSLKTMGRKRVDLLLLHSQIVPNSWECARHLDLQSQLTISLSLYQRAVVPAMQKLMAEGLCQSWGITAIGPNVSVNQALRAQDPMRRPNVAQCVINALESAGALDFADPTQNTDHIREVAAEMGVGVLGIRLVQAGALTNAMDREPRGGDERDFEDYRRASWLREFANRLQMPVAMLAYRYGLADKRVDSFILGVKNRSELADCLQAEREGPLEAEHLEEIRTWHQTLPSVH